MLFFHFFIFFLFKAIQLMLLVHLHKIITNKKYYKGFKCNLNLKTFNLSEFLSLENAHPRFIIAL